jgi:hypothetical protein
MSKTVPDEIEELRAAIREGHEVLQDLNVAIKEAKSVVKELPQIINDKIETTVSSGLKDFQVALQTAIGKATASVYRRFDTLAAICLGEDPQAVANGERSMSDMIATIIAKREAIEVYVRKPKE